MDIAYKDYIPPSIFGMEIDLFVQLDDGTEIPLADAQASLTPVKRLVIKSSKATLKNHNYTVVVDGVKGISGSQLGEVSVSMITSEFAPLYAKPIELRPILRGLMSYFSIYELYAALRDAGQKAHQMQRLQVDANNSRFKLLDDRSTVYVPTQKFVVYEAAKTLLSSLLVNMLSQEKVGNPTETMNSGDSVSLGDLSISTKSNSSSGTNSSSGDSPLDMVSQTLDAVSKELKFWMDAMMGRNNRGYASPVSASMRLNNGETPGERGLE